MFAARPRVPGTRPDGPLVARTMGDVAWKLTWPSITTTVLASVMIICTIIIGGLEIASLAISTSSSFYGNTSSTGAGFWCGLFFVIAAVLILMISK
jgi:phage-related protein